MFKYIVTLRENQCQSSCVCCRILDGCFLYLACRLSVAPLHTVGNIIRLGGEFHVKRNIGNHLVLLDRQVAIAVATQKQSLVTYPYRICVNGGICYQILHFHSLCRIVEFGETAVCLVFRVRLYTADKDHLICFRVPSVYVISQFVDIQLTLYRVAQVLEASNGRVVSLYLACVGIEDFIAILCMMHGITVKRAAH